MNVMDIISSYSFVKRELRNGSRTDFTLTKFRLERGMGSNRVNNNKN